MNAAWEVWTIINSRDTQILLAGKNTFWTLCTFRRLGCKNLAIFASSLALAPHTSHLVNVSPPNISIQLVYFTWIPWRRTCLRPVCSGCWPCSCGFLCGARDFRFWTRDYRCECTRWLCMDHVSRDSDRVCPILRRLEPSRDDPSTTTSTAKHNHFTSKMSFVLFKFREGICFMYERVELELS